MAAAPKMQITEPPRYVFTTGTVFPMVFKPSPNTISTKKAGTRLIGTQPAAIHAAVRANTMKYNGSGRPRIFFPLPVFACVFSFIVSFPRCRFPLKASEGIAAVVHGLFDSLDYHVIAALFVDLHMNPVPDLSPEKRLSKG